MSSMTWFIHFLVYVIPARLSLMTSYSAPTTISSDDWGLMLGSIGSPPAPVAFQRVFGSGARRSEPLRLMRSRGSRHGPICALAVGSVPGGQGGYGLLPLPTFRLPAAGCHA